MKKIGLAAAVLLAMTGAHAYQFEIGAGSEYIDASALNDKDFTGNFNATVYAKNVDTSKGPLAEAAFLDKASNLSVGYSYAPTSISYDLADIKTHTVGAKAEVYTPTKVPVYASATYNYTKTKVDVNDGFAEAVNELLAENEDLNDLTIGDLKDNGDRYSVELGVMPADNFLVAVGYANTPNQFALDTFGIQANGVFSGVTNQLTSLDREDTVTARAKYVGNIGDNGKAIGFEVGGAFADTNQYVAKTDLYLNPQFNVGASVILNDEENTLGFDKAWGVHTNYFVTPQFSVGASYVNANNKFANLDTQTIGLNAKARF